MLTTKKQVIQAVGCTCLWFLWKYRNDVVHESKKIKKSMIVDSIHEFVFRSYLKSDLASIESVRGTGNKYPFFSVVCIEKESSFTVNDFPLNDDSKAIMTHEMIVQRQKFPLIYRLKKIDKNGRQLQSSVGMLIYELWNLMISPYPPAKDKIKAITNKNS
ncbi:hypothetical protein LXL04_003710 [Taraxacum kok-saghyz]